MDLIAVATNDTIDALLKLKDPKAVPPGLSFEHTQLEDFAMYQGAGYSTWMLGRIDFVEQHMPSLLKYTDSCMPNFRVSPQPCVTNLIDSMMKGMLKNPMPSTASLHMLNLPDAVS